MDAYEMQQETAGVEEHRTISATAVLLEDTGNSMQQRSSPVKLVRRGTRRASTTERQSHSEPQQLFSTADQENESLRQDLVRASEQMARYIQERDSWRESYTAVIKERQQQNEQRSNRSAWSPFGMHPPDYKRRWEEAEGKLRLTSESCRQYKRRKDDLERELSALRAEHAAREESFSSGVQQLIEDRNQKQAENERLMEQCEDLLKQSGSRRFIVPLEDEEALVKSFMKLNAAVKNWCLVAWDLWPKNCEVRFSNFPLAHDANSDQITIYDSRLFIACTWEWLLKDIFGHLRHTPEDFFDLWLDEKTARHLKTVEDKVKGLQGKFDDGSYACTDKLAEPEIAQEWKSFTMQCLSRSQYVEPDGSRVDGFVEKIKNWIESMLPLELRTTQGLGLVMAKFRSDVACPAILLSYLLRKRFSPVVIASPLSIGAALRRWKQRSELTSDMELVTMPEMRRFEVSTLNDETPAYSVIVQPFIHSVQMHS